MLVKTPKSNPKLFFKHFANLWLILKLLWKVSKVQTKNMTWSQGMNGLNNPYAGGG